MRAFLHPPIYLRDIAPSGTPAVHWTWRAPQFFSRCRGSTSERFLLPRQETGSRVWKPPFPRIRADSLVFSARGRRTGFRPRDPLSLPRQQEGLISAAAAGHCFGRGNLPFPHIRADSLAFSARGRRTFFVHRSLSSLPWQQKWGVSAAPAGHWFRAFLPYDVPKELLRAWKPSFSPYPC